MLLIAEKTNELLLKIHYLRPVVSFTTLEWMSVQVETQPVLEVERINIGMVPIRVTQAKKKNFCSKSWQRQETYKKA